MNQKMLFNNFVITSNILAVTNNDKNKDVIAGDEKNKIHVIINDPGRGSDDIYLKGKKPDEEVREMSSLMNENGVADTKKLWPHSSGPGHRKKRSMVSAKHKPTPSMSRT
jgi:hypothetical protein